MSLDLFRKLQKAGIEVLAGDPGTGLFEGRLFYNSTAQALKIYEAGAWKLTASLGAVGDTITPVGSIVAYNPGYYTNSSNSGFTLVGPAGNTAFFVNAFLPANWRVCNGAALNDGGSTIWNAAGRFLPNLIDSRFLRGNSSAGLIGGQSSVTLLESDLPAHTHTMNHDHASFTTSGQSVNHDHTINHDHASQSTTSQSADTSMSWLLMDGNQTSADTRYTYWNRSGAGGTYSSTGINSTHTHGLDLPAFSGQAGVASANHNHDLDLPAFSGSTGSIGSGSAFDITPVYLTTFFIIRVK